MTPHHIYQNAIQHREFESEVKPRHAEYEYCGEQGEGTGIERQYVGIFHQWLALSGATRYEKIIAMIEESEKLKSSI